MSNEPKRKGISSPLAGATGRFNPLTPVQTQERVKRSFLSELEEASRTLGEVGENLDSLAVKLGPLLGVKVAPLPPVEPGEELTSRDSMAVQRALSLSEKAHRLNAQILTLLESVEI